MKIAAALANSAWLASSISSWNRFRRALRHPRETQVQILRRYLIDNAASAYGVAHGFGAISNYQHFRELVPVVGYDELEPWIARIMQGERSVLTCAPVTRLVPTSGSTGARKLIPFTAGLGSEFNAAIGPWMVDLCRHHPAIVLGPAYWSISPALASLEIEESAIPIGFDDDSAYLGGIRQRLVESTFAAPSALRLVSDVVTFRYLTLLCLLRQPELRLVSVWHPSFLTLLLDSLPVFWDELLEDLEHGGCRRGAPLPAALRRVLEAEPQRRRAEELRQSGPGSAVSLWPRLSLVSCWGDGQASFLLNDLQKRIPGVAIQSKGLLATEGVISIPFCDLHPIAIGSHFYEFADARGEIHTADRLHVGEVYTVILTTSGGLWRYRLGDQVEVDGFVASTPSLRFLGRGNKTSDVCGEKLHEAFVTRALETALTACECVPAFAIIAPEKPGTGEPHYTLFTEGAFPIRALQLLEDALRKNPHYAHCRNLGQLGPLTHCPIQGSGYEILARLEFESGRRLGDIKPQTLSARTDLRSYFAPDQRGV